MTFLDKLIQNLSGGVFSIGSMINVSAAGLVTERDKFFTQQGVSKVYQILEMPPIYTKDIISQVTMGIIKLNKKLSVKTYYEITPAQISINTPAYINNMNRSIQKYLEYKEIFERLPKEVQESGVYHDNGVRKWSFTSKDVKARKHRHDSYVDVNNHIRNDNGVYFLVSLFVTVVFPDLDTLTALDSQVRNILAREAARVTSMDKQIATLLSSFSPSVLNKDGNKAPTMLVSEENLTQLLPIRSEGVLSVKGIPLGTNIGNKTRLNLDLFSKPEGSCAVIAAKAGKGKSTMGYTFTLNLIGARHTVIYLDLKGTEVSRCLKAAMSNIITLDFSQKSGVFINTMHLSKFVSDYTMDDALVITSEMLAIFINLNENTEGNITDVHRILKHAIRSYYNSVGVVDGVPDTYDLSEQMTYMGLMKYIGEQSNADENKRLAGLFELIPERLTDSFIQFGMKTNETAVDLDSLFGYDAIVISFNKNTDLQVSIVDQVKIYMSLMVTKRIARYNRKNDIFTIFMAEEAQSYISLPGLCSGVSALASQGRSDNLSVIAIMNNLNILRDPSLSSFRSNIASFVIGSCDEEAVSVLRDVFLKPRLADDVRAIIKNPKKYERVFAVHFEIGSIEINAMVRCDIPKEVADMFATRTILEEEEEEI